MAENTQGVGRANMALVLQDDNQRAAISTIIVHRRKSSRRRLSFIGKVEFSKPVKKHTTKIILPIIDCITDTLGLDRKNFEVSAINLGAASTLDLGIVVSGLSVDVSMLISMLSYALQVPVSDNLVATGHIASVDGDISAVEGIPAKIEAAKNNKFIKYFIYPDLEKDESLKVLSPNERSCSIDAVISAGESVCTRAVSNIGQLARLVFTEASIVMASLKAGFFDISMIPDQFNNPCRDVISFLTCNNEKRFWDILDRHFLTGHCKKGKELLEAFVQFYLKEKLYPADFGAGLFQLICSLPPAIRKRKMDFPIIEKRLCNKLGNLAGEEKDYDDAHILYEAACGNVGMPKTKTCQSSSIDTQPEIKMPDGDYDCIVFDTVVSQIKARAIAKHVGSSIDSARGSFILESSTVETFENFVDKIVAYYIHMQRYISSSPDKAADMTMARTEAIALLQRTFRDKGGDQAAFATARDGIRNGMRGILDALTEQYKAEKSQAYIELVFNDAIEALGWDERVRCIRGLIKRMGQSLPEEIRDEPPERFARNYKSLLRIYVKSLDNVEQLLRTM